MAGFEDELAKEIADLIRQHVAVVTKPLRDRIEALELRIIKWKNRLLTSNTVAFGATARAIGDIIS